MKIPDITIRSLQSEEHKIAIAHEIADLSNTYNGEIGSASGDEYPIKKNIIELLGSDVGNTTLAQGTNFWGLTADAYEDYWRNNSIKTISGEDFSIEDEQNRLVEWLKPQDGKKYADLGCSTALYARTIQKAAPGAAVVAIDFSLPMLRKAREKALSEQRSLYLMQANVENMPFFAGFFDGLTCGGSLNEFRDPVKALYESRRVIKKGGLFFLMYLLKADNLIGTVIQKTSSIGGISFWSESEAANLFERTGFQIKKQERHGVVHFVLLEAV
jgi:SAM-dependent methyltransferase